MSFWTKCQRAQLDAVCSIVTLRCPEPQFSVPSIFSKTLYPTSRLSLSFSLSSFCDLQWRPSPSSNYLSSSLSPHYFLPLRVCKSIPESEKLYAPDFSEKWIRNSTAQPELLRAPSMAEPRPPSVLTSGFPITVAELFRFAF